MLFNKLIFLTLILLGYLGCNSSEDSVGSLDLGSKTQIPLPKYCGFQNLKKFTYYKYCESNSIFYKEENGHISNLPLINGKDFIQISPFMGKTSNKFFILNFEIGIVDAATVEPIIGYYYKDKSRIYYGSSPIIDNYNKDDEIEILTSDIIRVGQIFFINGTQMNVSSIKDLVVFKKTPSLWRYKGQTYFKHTLINSRGDSKVKPLNSNYYLIEDMLFNLTRHIGTLDSDTAKAFKSHFAWDSTTLFKGTNKTKLDPKLFSSINDKFYKYNNKIYVINNSKEVPNADPETFKTFQDSSYAQDAGHIYYLNHIVDEVKPSMLTPAIGPYFAISENKLIHYERVIENLNILDLKNIQFLNSTTFRWKDKLFSGSRQIKSIQLDSSKPLTQISGYVFSDGKYLYCTSGNKLSLNLDTFGIISSSLITDGKKVYKHSSSQCSIDNDFKNIGNDYKALDTKYTYIAGKLYRYNKILEENVELKSIKILGDDVVITDKSVFFRDTLLENARPESFKEVDAHEMYNEFNSGVILRRYFTDEITAFYRNEKLEATTNEIKNLKTLGTGFALSDSHAFFRQWIIKDASPSTFEVINWNFSKDAENVFYKTNIFAKANASTFVSVSGSTAFTKDNNHVFYNNEIVSEVNVSKFRHLVDDNWGTDEEKLIFKNIISGPEIKVDFETLEVRSYITGHPIIEDKNFKYSFNSKENKIIATLK